MCACTQVVSPPIHLRPSSLHVFEAKLLGRSGHALFPGLRECAADPSSRTSPGQQGLAWARGGTPQEQMAPGLRGGDRVHNGINDGALTNWHCGSGGPACIPNFTVQLYERGWWTSDVAPAQLCLLFRVRELVVLCCAPLIVHLSFGIVLRSPLRVYFRYAQ